MSLSADVNYQVAGPTSRRHVNLAAASANTFYKGAIVAFNASGLLVEAADTSGFHSAGIVTKQTAIPAAGGNLEYETGVVRVLYASAAQTDLGKLVYPTADDTLALSATNISALGVVEGVEVGVAVWVNTDRRAI